MATSKTSTANEGTMRAVQAIEPSLYKFHFPEYGMTIEATSQAEALKILETRKETILPPTK
jgi:hypothetical protein